MSKFSKFITIIFSLALISLLMAQASIAAPQKITYEEWFSATLSNRIDAKMQRIDARCSGGSLSQTNGCYVSELNHVLIMWSKDRNEALGMVGNYPAAWKEEARRMFNDPTSTYKLCLSVIPQNPSGARQSIYCTTYASQWLTLMVELQTKGQWRPYNRNADEQGE